MQVNRKYILIPILFFSLLATSCGSSGGDSSSFGSAGGSGSSSPTVSQQTVKINGSIADVTTASLDKNPKSYYFSKIKEYLTIVKIANAQNSILEGIMVEVYVSGEAGDPVATALTDMNGLFTVDVPCDTLLTFIFTYDSTSFILDGFSTPCPELGETSEVSMTVELDLEEETIETEVEEEEEEESAMIGCTDNEIVEVMDDVMINGNGGPCVITTGQCVLDIKASSVVLENCTTCFDTRGGSMVNIETNNFSCTSTDDGIRSVGNSGFKVQLIAPALMENCFIEGDEDFNGFADCEDPTCVENPLCLEGIEICNAEGIDEDGDELFDCDDPDCAEDAFCLGLEVCNNGGIDDDGDELADCDDPDCLESPACVIMEEEIQSISILSGRSGISAKGNSLVMLGAISELEVEDETEGPITLVFPGDITIIGSDNSIEAVGNTDVVIEGTDCFLEPEEPSDKGNASVEINCSE